MTRFLFLVALTLVTFVANAIPARRGLWKTVTLKDGTTVRVELCGDERLHYWQTADGKCYHVDDANRATLITDMAALRTKAKAKVAARNVKRKVRTRALGNKRLASVYSGRKKGLIILAQFSDKKFATGHDKALFQRIANEENFTHPDGFVGSVKDYFKAQSNGMFELDFDIVGPVTLSKKMAYYGQDIGGEGNDAHPGEMVAEALNAVDAEVDFSVYDWDADGEVDQVYILYAGYGQASSGIVSTVWPHEWTLTDSDYGNTLTLDNVVVNTYACSNELSEGTVLNGIGTICHEFSHCLGLPDMYDTYEKDGVNFGMNSWDLMDYGGYNGDGFVPAGYTSYEKMFAGWLTPIELKNDTVVTSMKALGENGEAYIIYNDKYKDEYYLLENRQKTSWDGKLPGAGLLILHVDFNQAVWNSNEVNNVANRQRCTIFHADGRDGTTDYDLLGDPYPYAGNDSLTNSSSPMAVLYNANTDGRKLMSKAITGITQNGDGTIAFAFRNDNLKQVDVIKGDTLFYESFDKCSGIGGNDNQWKGRIASGAFLPDNQGWISETSSEYGAYQCARFGTGNKYGMETSPTFPVVDGSVITFKAASWASESNVLTVESSNENVTLTPSTFSLANLKWTDCEIKVQGTGAIQLTFKGVKQRYFLDEVLVLKPKKDITGIEDLRHDTSTRQDNRIYSIDGRYLGTDFNVLQKGIYIMNGKKVIK